VDLQQHIAYQIRCVQPWWKHGNGSQQLSRIIQYASFKYKKIKHN